VATDEVLYIYQRSGVSRGVAGIVSGSPSSSDYVTSHTVALALIVRYAVAAVCMLVRKRARGSRVSSKAVLIAAAAQNIYIRADSNG
jgi:hypothetical protein